MTAGPVAEARRRRAGRARVAVASLAVTLSLLAAGPAPGAEPGRAVPAELLGKARARGTVRVIVELGGVGAVPEGELGSDAAVAVQRARIAADRAALRAALRGLRPRVLREFRTLPYVVLEVDPDALRVLDALPGLATRVQEDIRLRPLLGQSGPLVKAPSAWAAGWDGSGQVVAVLDTGVDAAHPFLAGKVIEEACYDTSGVSSCPNGLPEQTGAGAGAPCTFAPGDCAHGTHVAGIAAGQGSTFHGVARGASLMAIQVFHREDDGAACAPAPAPCALAFFADVVAGLERVYELRHAHDFAAANLSLGSGAHTGFCDGTLPAMDAVIGNLRAAGIATVVASGNDGFLNALSFPACISTAISVGATGDGSGGWPADQVAWFSNSAAHLSLLAPGALVSSSVPGGGFASLAGTSMAAPHVAGAWAIAKQATPAAAVTDVLAGLQNTGKLVTDVNGVTTPRIAATVLQFSAGAYSGTEATGTATITVTRSGALFGPHVAPLTVDYATGAGTAVPGQDYGETSGTLTFGPGETSRTFTVAVTNDAAVNGPRTVNLTLTSPEGGALLGARAGAVLTIVDNDVAGAVQFVASAFSAGEQAGTATITVSRTGGSAGGVTVHYATSDGTAREGIDYQAAAGALSFGPDETSRTFPVTILPNSRGDGNRTVHLGLHTPGGGAVLGARKTAVLTIVDDEVTLEFGQTGYTVSEGGGSATITVTRSGPPTPVEVTYSVLPGSASPGADYGGASTGVLAFTADQASRTFAVPIVNDALAEGPETVLLQLSSPTAGALLGPRQTAVLTILDNDVGGTFRFGASTYGAGEGQATATVTVTRSVSRGSGSAASAAVRVRTVAGGTAVPGVDYEALDQVVAFAASEMVRTVPLTLLTASNVTVEGPRTIRLALEEPGPPGLAHLGQPAGTTVTIGDDDAGGTIQWSPTSVSVSEAAGSAILTAVRAGGGADQVGATWTITGGTAVHGVDYAGDTTGPLAWGEGTATQTLSIPLLNPPGPQGTRTIQVTLGAATGGATLGAAQVATVTLVDDEVGLRFSHAQYSAEEKKAGQTITVLRTGPTAAGVSVAFTTVEGEDGTAVPGIDYTPVSGVLQFLAGQASRSFTVPLKNDRIVDGSRTVKLRLSDPTGGAALGTPAEAVLALADDDTAGAFRFASGTYSVGEGAGAVSLTVTRAGGVGGAVEVPWSVAAGTAARAEAAGPGVDVVLGPSGVLTFGPDETSKTIQVQVVDDAEVEPNETLTLTLGAPSAGGALAAPSSATLIVVDDDRKGTVGFSAPAVSVAEGGGPIQLTLTRTGAVDDPATAVVEWTITGGTATHGVAAGPGVDVVVPGTQVVEFLPGQGTRLLTLDIAHDADAEGPETLSLALQSPDPQSGWALGPIPATTLTLVEGTVQFAAPALRVSERSGSATITVTRSGLATHPVTVSYALAAGSATPALSPAACAPGADYRPVSGTLLFGPGQTSRTFSVPLCKDVVAEGDETLSLVLAVVSGPAILGVPGTATLTILEDDLGGAFRFSSAGYAASEAQAAATLTVERTAKGGGATVGWAVVGGTAVHGVHYTGPTAGDLLFAAGQTSRPLVIPLVNTAAAEGPRTVLVELSDPQPAGFASVGAPAQATLTIGDDEPTLRLSSAAYVASEGSPAVSVTVLRAGPPGATVTAELVPLATSSATGGTCGTGAADFAASPVPVTLGPREMSKTVPLPLCADTHAEGPETFTVELQSPGGASLGSPAAATVSLTDNELGGTLAWSVADASGVEGTGLVLTVVRTGGLASDVTVQVTAHEGDADTPGDDALAGLDYAAPPPTTLTFGAGDLSQTVEIPLLARDGAQGPRAFRVVLHDVTGGAALGSPATATVWILDPG